VRSLRVYGGDGGDDNDDHDDVSMGVDVLVVK